MVVLQTGFQIFAPCTPMICYISVNVEPLLYQQFPIQAADQFARFVCCESNYTKKSGGCQIKNNSGDRFNFTFP